jgi:hypothetical protein
MVGAAQACLCPPSSISAHTFSNGTSIHGSQVSMRVSAEIKTGAWRRGNARMYSMEDFRNDFVEFFSGLTFWVTMALMSTYLVAYIKFLQKVAVGDNRNERDSQLPHYVNVVFWERLRRFDFFAVLYIIVCFAFLALPFAVVHTKQLK